MASQLLRTLTKTPTQKLLPISLSSSLSSLFSTKARLIEVDLDSSSDGGGDMEVMVGFKKLEDAIHNIIARRLAPDWLPFRPGSSYWVPPKRHSSDNIAHLVDKLTNPLTPEESLSLTSSRGWPSSSFFCGGAISGPAIPVEVEVQVLVPSNSGEPSMSEDEEIED